MKRLCLSIIVVLFVSVGLNAQVIISSDMFSRVSFTLKTEVLDSLTREPVAFASVYLRHPNDTVITNFTLTDSLGKATLGDVAKGEHLMCVELLGYKPYYRKMYVRDDAELKAVFLQQDEEMLKAAQVSAVANAMEIKQDTIIYNAASYKTLSNDSLAELLKKMPGIEVGSDGSVKVNGKAVSKITVNGKTFFLGDQKSTLDNLPAKFVDKVKVIDKEKDENAFSGIKGDKEKVMDVELKEEYKNGWFGNLKLGGGTSVPGKDDNDYVEHKDFLYSNSGMFSAYGKKAQMTALAGANNFIGDDYGMFIVYSDDDSERNDTPQLGFDGFHSRWNAGVNVSSDSLLRGFDASASVAVSSESVDRRTSSERTTFKVGSDEQKDLSEQITDGKLGKYRLSFEIKKKDKKKTILDFTQALGMHDYNSVGNGSSSSSQTGDKLNWSGFSSFTDRRVHFANGDVSVGVKAFGKPRRSLTLTAGYYLSGTSGTAGEASSLWFADRDSPILKNLSYDQSASTVSLRTGLRYVEPFGERWALSVRLYKRYTVRKNTSDASNADGTVNDYYSSISDTYYDTNTASLLLQYAKGETSIQAGGDLKISKDENYAKSFGIDTRTGKDDWRTVVSPYLNFRTRISGRTLSTYYSSDMARPSASSIVPTINIASPTRIFVGNIYLKQSVSHTMSNYFYGKVGKSQLDLSVYLRASQDPQVSALWFDDRGVRYSIPVNSQDPSFNGSVYFSGNTALTKSRVLSLNYSFSGNYTYATSYQSRGILPGIDTDSFDYADFMSSFWGDARGDIFYSGKSGFEKSSTRSMNVYGSLRAVLNLERLNLSLRVAPDYSHSSYSLDSRADMNTWRWNFGLSPTYSFDNEIELSTTLNYNIRRGFGEGYNYNYFLWEAKVGKSIKAFTISLEARDILNQTRYLAHNVYDNYIEDTYTNVLGRRILLSVTWNFGKSTSAQLSSARTKALYLGL